MGMELFDLRARFDKSRIGQKNLDGLGRIFHGSLCEFSSLCL